MFWFIFHASVFQENSRIIFGLERVASLAVTVCQLTQKNFFFDERVLFLITLVTLVAAVLPFILKALW